MSVDLRLGDCLAVLPTLDADSIDTVVTDPPYFRVKNEAWDRQRANGDAFIAWLGRVLDELARVLKPNGSLYLFAGTRIAARVELAVAERFHVLNSITWAKPDPSSTINYGASRGGSAQKESLRTYFPASEKIIFAEHYGADNMAKGEAGYAAKCDELRGFVFEPIRAYLDGERRRAGIGFEQVREIVGCAPGSGLPSHWFTRSQWMLPTERNYLALRDGFSRMDHGGDYLRREYEDLRREYEDLRREYEDLRRPFTVTPDVPYTDVWTFATVGHYPGKHPCEKPQDMLRHMITASTRPGAVVLDPFMGRGSAGIACKALGRSFVGIEIGAEHFRHAQARIGAARYAECSDATRNVATPRHPIDSSRNTGQLALFAGVTP